VWNGKGAVAGPRYPTLHHGAEGVPVKRLQVCLRRKGYRLPVTGWFGPKTLAAVKHYQHRKGVRVDGVVGPVTWRMLRWRPPAKRPTPTPKPTPAAHPTHKPPAPRPKTKPSPSGILTGPDVSVYQGDIDWERVRRAGSAFAIVKATEGRHFRDKRFGPARWKAMRDAGLIRGAYHFARPSAESADATLEARDFFKAVESVGGLQEGDLPLVLDLEVTRLSGPATLEWTGDFVAEIRRLSGRRPLLYVSPGFWHGVLGDPRQTFGCRLWVAHYGVKKPAAPTAWKSWTFWQHTDKGRVDGIAGTCDLNRFRGTVADLQRVTL
jgi:lysozyme